MQPGLLKMCSKNDVNLASSTRDKYYWEDQYQNALEEFNQAYRQSKQDDSYRNSLIACSNVYKIVVQFEQEALKTAKTYETFIKKP